MTHPWHKDEVQPYALPHGSESAVVLDEAEPEQVPDEDESVSPQPEPGVVPIQGPFQARGRHVTDLHMRRIATCNDLPGKEATAMAAMISAALNR